MDWFRRFSDGEMIYGKTLAQVMTTTLMRLADAPVLPFEFHTLSRTVHGYVDEIQKEALIAAERWTSDVQAQLARLHGLHRPTTRNSAR